MEMDTVVDGPLRLNIGCGGRKIPGYIGVDAVARSAAEIIAPANNIDLPSESVDEIIAIHLWEHFYLWECDGVIAEWRRLLKPGGVLTFEMPDVIKCAKNLIAGKMVGGKDPNQLSYWGLYGDPRTQDPYMNHRWGWTPATLRDFLTTKGFVKIREQETQWHPAGRWDRDFRMTCRKPL
jgi:SAM-dependent methyltransferase